MTFTLSFLLGVVLIATYGEFEPLLPGAGSLARLAPWLPLLLVPVLCTRLALFMVRRTSPHRLTRAVLTWTPFTVPAVLAVLLYFGRLPEWVDVWVPNSWLAQLVLLILPLVLMEVSLRVGEDRVAHALARRGLDTPVPMGPRRLPGKVFLLVPVLGTAALVDALVFFPAVETFFLRTNLGQAVGVLILGMLFVAALPLLFRLVFSTTPNLPQSVAAPLRATASRLGFSARSLLAMNTDHRMVNAMLVGPLPWPRYLVLTDGLLSILDLPSLQGVVAHEVGHARARHPMLFLVAFLFIPMCLLFALSGFDLGALDIWLQLMIAAVVLGVGLVCLRLLAHRFEHEADVLSAAALGGSESCIRALHRVGQLAPTSAHRSSLRHPSERKRVATLLRWESDPEFRAAFNRRGRVLRRALGVTAGVALFFAGWVMMRGMPLDRARQAFFAGHFTEAAARVDAIDSAVLPAAERASLERFRRAVLVAGELMPNDPATWQQGAEALGARAWVRAQELLEQGDSGTAKSYLWLSTAAPGAWPIRRSLYLWADAVERGDGELEQLYATHLRTLDVPSQLKFLFAS